MTKLPSPLEETCFGGLGLEDRCLIEYPADDRIKNFYEYFNRQPYPLPSDIDLS